MGLEGSIEEFGLADILQLLYFQKKTGLLVVEGRLGRVKISFAEGNIVDVETKGRLEEKRLGKVLVKKGLLSEDALREVLQKQQESGERLGAFLIRNSVVAREAVQEVIVNQLTEAIVQVFGWKQGSYEFKPQKVTIDKDLQVMVDTQHLLMDGLRIVDEWSTIEGKITLDTIFRKRSVQDVELNEREAKVLYHVDGESDVSSIIELSGDEDTQVIRTLLSLMEKTVIEKIEQRTYVAPTPVVRKFRGPSPVVVSLVGIAVLLLSLVLSLGTLRAGKRDYTAVLRAVQEVQRLRLSVERERFTAGAYPAALPDAMRSLRDPWGHEYGYRLTETGYELRSPGPDGLPGTPDDIY